MEYFPGHCIFSLSILKHLIITSFTINLRYETVLLITLSDTVYVSWTTIVVVDLFVNITCRASIFIESVVGIDLAKRFIEL